MGKGRDKRRGKPNKQGQRTREEVDLVKQREIIRNLERKLSAQVLAPRSGSAPPPILGEPDPLVLAPLKPKPHLRSGAIALREPEPEDGVFDSEPQINIE